MIPRKSSSRQGFALILVLAFILLVVTVVLVLFSNSILQRQISSSSADLTKVDLFAQGALETTIGDLKQEIVAGSSASGTAPNKIYWPTAPATMVPYRVGTDDTLPNLVKTSTSGQLFYQGTNYTAAGPSRAANSATTSTSSSYYVTLQRWNAPLLLPKQTPGQNTDLTPSAKFTAPSWIYVDRGGNNPTAISKDIVGRYAYCIYDEGGLLDMNVAGYPKEMDPALAANKIGSSFADLTQTGLTTQIDNLLGWRNYASAQPTGSFPAYAFTAASALNYYNSVVFNPWGFMSVGNGALYNGQSDQRFMSRQQLINYISQTLAASSDLLQYMGTFSRALDQPSYRPDPKGPTVVADSTTYPGLGQFSANAAGNDAYGRDSQINPFFLNVPVTASFTRNDGTAAIVGEPLVKKRFALNRLAWITYKGPSADNMTDTTVQAAITQLGGNPADTTDPVYQFVALGTASNIVKYFNLTWNGSFWIYNNGNGIGELSAIQGTREADFFELLQAALKAGSLGKAAAACHGASYPNSLDIDQYGLDTDISSQVIQIGANMVDQFDSDSYPTHIQYAGRDFYGVENLPYLYRARGIGINLSLANHQGAMLMLPEVWNPHDPNSPVGYPVPTNFRFMVSSPFPCSAYSQTRVWDPTSTILTEQPGPGPEQNIPLDPPTLPAGSGLTELDFIVPAGSTADRQPVFVGGLKGTAQATAMPASAPSTNNVHTLLPALGANVDSNGYIQEDATASTSNPLNYLGVLLGTFITQWTDNVTVNGQTMAMTYPLSYTTPPPSPFQNYWGPLNPSSSDECFTTSFPFSADFVLQYKDANGNWATYQDNHSSLPVLASMSTVKAGGYPAPTTAFIDITANDETGSWTTWMDPRTSRFGSSENTEARAGMITAGFYGVTDRPNTDWGAGCYYYTPGSGLPGGAYFVSPNAYTIGWYPGNFESDTAQLFDPGFYADNSVSVTRTPQGAPVFFTDPDGVARRGMSGYAAETATTTVGLPLANLSSSATQAASRPYILNRPYRSVAELGYVFSGTPWRNLDFFTPESGSAALLDLFCLNETPDPNALVAGRVNLNTRQAPVLQALLSGSGAGGLGAAYKDVTNPGVSGATTELSPTEVTQIAQALITRTTSTVSGQGPLENVADLVGRWNGSVTISGATAPNNIDGSKSYTGFSSDLSPIFAATDPSLSTCDIQRLRESALRALSTGGQTRVWNLMIDLVAQTGRYRPGETSLDNLLVDGEQRYWLHIAIDRFTGKVIDEQLEPVKE